MSLGRPRCCKRIIVFHCTEPWSGDRVVLVGFSVDYSGLQRSEICQLLELGFVLVPTPAGKGGLSEPHQSFPPLPPIFASGAQSSQVDGGEQTAYTLQVRSGPGAQGQSSGLTAPCKQVPCSGAQVRLGPGAPGQTPICIQCRCPRSGARCTGGRCASPGLRRRLRSGGQGSCKVRRPAFRPKVAQAPRVNVHRRERIWSRISPRRRTREVLESYCLAQYRLYHRAGVSLPR